MKKITNKLIQEFKTYLIEEEKSDSTLEKYIRDITVFMNWLGNEEITKAKVLEYKKELIENYAPASVNSILSSLNSFFNYNEWHECKVKTLKIQRQIFANKDKELTKSEYERLLKAAQSKKNKRLYYLMQTICSSGLRVSELKYVDVNAVHSGQALINCKGKMRIVILPKKLCKMLKSYIKEQGIIPYSVKGFDIDWALSNDTNYTIENGQIVVYDYTDIDDEELILTARIDVYPDQEPVVRKFIIKTSIIRPEIGVNINIDSQGAEDYLKREDVFTYNITCIPSDVDGFDYAVSPVYTDINYSYKTLLPDGTDDAPYDTIVTINEDSTYQINADATLGAELTITVDVGHYIGGEFVIDEKIEKTIHIAERTFTVNYHANGGTVLAISDGRTIESANYMEESVLFEDVIIERPGYLFEGWYTDEACTEMFWAEGRDKPIMPANELNLYAKWAAHSLVLYFESNGGDVDNSSKAILCGVPVGELPIPTQTGYTFIGWFTTPYWDGEQGEEITSETIIETAEDIQLYANWHINSYKCPLCNKTTSYVHDYRIRIVKDISAFGKFIVLLFKQRRYVCKECGKRFSEDNCFTPKYYRITHRLLIDIFKKLENEYSFTSVAKASNISTSTVIRFFDMLAYPSPKEPPKVLAIDEFKGNTGKEKYQAIITDPENGLVLDILPDRKTSHLNTYVKHWERSNRLKVKYFVSDMWKPYADLASTYFKNSTQIVDKYHYIRQIIWAFERVRKEEQKRYGKKNRLLFKHSKTLLTKRNSKLKPEQLERVEHILYISDNIRSAYYLKELFYTVIDCDNPQEAKRLMCEWIMIAQASRLKDFKYCATTLQNWANSILNTFDCPYTNGFTEGCNNKIKVLKRNAYGYKNFERFRKRILHMFNYKKNSIEKAAA